MEFINLKDCKKKQYIKQVAELQIELWDDDFENVSEYEKSIRSAINRENYTILGAINEKNEIMGYIELDMSYSYEERYTPIAIMQICGLYVSPKYRHQGVAKGLMRESEKLGLAMGCLQIASSYYEFNNASANLHKDMGFVETSKIISVIKNISQNDID